MEINIVDLSHVTGVKNNLCYGIARTIEMADKKAQSYHTERPIYVYFHLPAGASEEQRGATLETLNRRYGPLGSGVIMVDKVDEVPEGVPFIIGTRGASPQVREKVKERFEVVMDTTCPFVTTQEAGARRLLQEGYELVFCGLPEYHGMPRLQGIAELFNKKIYVVHRREDVDQLPFKRTTRVGVMLQTTWHMDLAKRVIAELVGRYREVKVIDTSCIDSLGRLPTARKLAEESEVVIVLDFGKVARHLEEELEEVGRLTEGSRKLRVCRIGSSDELRAEWFQGVKKVGIVGGVNVHAQALDAVATRIRELAGDTAVGDQ
jgi:4-hydroxy-3-methylbut-2-enyl diphosphate reductase IspH